LSSNGRIFFPEFNIRLYDKTLNQIFPDSSSVMTGFVLVSFSGRVLVVQEVLRTVIIAPYRKAILVLYRFCRCVVGTRDPGRCVHEIHIRIDCMHYVSYYYRPQNLLNN
jgi:hypothetical protein